MARTCHVLSTFGSTYNELGCNEHPANSVVTIRVFFRIKIIHSPLCVFVLLEIEVEISG